MAATFREVTSLLACAKLVLGRLNARAGPLAKQLLPGTIVWFVARDTVPGDGPHGAFLSGSGFLSHKLDASFQDMTERNVSFVMSNSSRTKSQHPVSCAYNQGSSWEGFHTVGQFQPQDSGVIQTPLASYCFETREKSTAV